MSGAFQLLLTLTGVTLLFACAQVNGTMERAARNALRLCRGRSLLLPVLFFAVAALLAAIGPGAIVSTAIVAPFAMTAGSRAGIPSFLTALMVANGANAGNMSPFSMVGVIASGLMTRADLGGHEFRVWFFHGLAHVVVAVVAYMLFGGLQLWNKTGGESAPPSLPLEAPHKITVAVTAAWVASVLLFRLPIGWPAFACGALLVMLRVAHLREAVQRMPWKIIALVVSISTAVSFIEGKGGLVWFQDLLARAATPHSAHAVIAALTGVISAYSSTSGVVLPAFLPLARGLADRLPGVDPIALSISMIIGSALVDVSPLSTLGALCLAAAPEGPDKRGLFLKLLVWGTAMVAVGAAFCFFASPLFA